MAGAFLLVGALAGAGPAAAHDSLVDASPRAGSTVEQLPGEVHLVFDREVQARLATVRVVGPDGAEVTRGAAVVEGTVVTQRSDRAAPAGSYRIVYRVVSGDGHPIVGNWQFTVATARTGSPTAAAAADISSSSGPDPVAIAALVAAVLGGAGSLVLRARVIRRAAAVEPPVLEPVA